MVFDLPQPYPWPIWIHRQETEDVRTDALVVDAHRDLLGNDVVFVDQGPICSMVLVYLPTKLGHLKGKSWDSYSSTMVRIWGR